MLISRSLDWRPLEPPLDAKQEARYTLLLEPVTPELCGQIAILLPFAPQLNTLVGLDSSDTSNSFPSFPSALYRLLKDGEVLHHILSKWIVLISPSIVARFAPAKYHPRRGILQRRESHRWWDLQEDLPTWAQPQLQDAAGGLVERSEYPTNRI